MSRRFITAIIAGAIVITGLTAAQAQAGNRDLARFLAGATALVIIGEVISNNNDRRHRPQLVTRSNRHHGHVHRPYDHRQARLNAAREQARHQALLRAQREEARRQEYLRERRREAWLEARRDDRREATRNSHFKPRPLPERVRRHEHDFNNR